jgi:GT2 family glycosyltransferase
MGPLISVIIPNRDGKEVIGPCLKSLDAQSEKPFEVIVVDDGSKDGSPEYIETNFPWVKTVSLDAPSGFAGAVCEGFSVSRGDWIAVLNSDTSCEENWISEILKTINSDTNAGMIASKVILSGDPVKIDSLGIKVNRACMAFLRKHGQEAEANDDGNIEVFGPAGSAAFYKREVIEKAGFFDADYFAYYEDVDLAFRARWAGFSCILAQKAIVHHHHSFTADRVRLNKRYYLQRNRWRTIIRNWPLSWFVLYSPFLIYFETASIVKCFLEGKFLTPFIARADVFRYLGVDLKIRKKTSSIKNINENEMGYWLYNDQRKIETSK